MGGESSEHTKGPSPQTPPSSLPPCQLLLRPLTSRLLFFFLKSKSEQSSDQCIALRTWKRSHFEGAGLRIPWTEESGRLQSIGLQRIRHY